MAERAAGLPVCVTCGTQFAAPAERCPICEDERQYVPPSGQAWTTLERLRDEHRNRIADEHGLTAIGTEPKFGIGQRALLVPWGDANLLWDCVTLLDDETEAAVRARGGLRAIAISHPHYYSAMVEWAHAFDCPVLLHRADAAWIMRPDPAVELWDGDVRELGDGLRLLRLGGHFAGATVLHHAQGADGRGALLAGDVVQVVPDRSHVGFMYSYPNLIPLPPATVRRIAAALSPRPFEVIYGAWWDAVVTADGHEVVQRSARRYVRAVRGGLEAT